MKRFHVLYETSNWRAEHEGGKYISIIEKKSGISLKIPYPTLVRILLAAQGKP